jgi:hypothetical protein
MHFSSHGFTRVPALEFKRFPQRNAKAVHQLLARGSLAFDTRHFLDPADPPLAGLLYDGGVSVLHSRTPIRSRLLTLDSRHKWLEQSGAVNDRGDQNAFLFHAVDDAIVVDESFAYRYVANLWHDAPHYREFGNRLSRFDDL